MAGYDIALILSTLTFVLVTFAYARSGKATIFHPATVYLAFHALVFVVRPIFARAYNFSSIYAAVGFLPSVNEKITTIAAVNLALVVFVAVSVWSAPRFVFRQSDEEDAGRPRMAARYTPAFVGLGALCIWALLWMWQFVGSGQELTDLDPRTGSQALIGVSGYFISMSGFMVSLGAIFAYLNRFRWWSFIPFAVFGVLRMGTGGRGEFIVACFVLGLLLLYAQRRVWPTRLLLLAILPVYLAFSAIVADRGEGLRESLGSRNQVDRVRYDTGDLAPLEHMDFGNLEFVEYVVHVVPERAGTYDYFAHLLQLFTEPIPRTLWQNKPYGPPVMPVDLYRYGSPVGMTMSVPGVGWYSLGYVGVVIWSAFFALIYAWGYRAFVRSRQNVVATIAYALFAGTAIIGFRDGALLTILKQYLFFAIPVVALMLTERLFRPMPARRPAAAGDNRRNRSFQTGVSRYAEPRLRRARLAARGASQADDAPRP